jgi:hypothetical protein
MKKGILAVCCLLSSLGLAACGNSSTAASSVAASSSAAAAAVSGKFTYDYQGAFGAEKAQFNFLDSTKCEFNLPENTMITDVYAGTYTYVDGTAANLKVVTVVGLTNKNTASSYVKPGLWAWIDSTTGNCQVTLDLTAKTFTPVQTATPTSSAAASSVSA